MSRSEEFATGRELDDTAVLIAGVEVLTYLDGEGSTCYRVRHGGDVGLAHLLGLLEMAKADLMAASDWEAG